MLTLDLSFLLPDIQTWSEGDAADLAGHSRIVLGGGGPCSTCCQALLPQHCTRNDCKRTLQEYEPPLSPFELYTDFCNFIDAAVLNVTYIMIEGADDAYCALVKV